METELKILALEDSVEDAGLIHYELRKLSIPYTFKVADNKEQFESLYLEYNPSIILSDYKVPGYNIFEAMKFVRKKNPLIPFIVISGVIGESKAVEVMLNGANNCIMKDKILRLIPAIEREIEEYNIKTKQKKEQEELILFREIFNHSHNSIAILDLNWKYQEQNARHNYIHGVNDDVIKTKTIHEIHSEEITNSFIKSIKEEGFFTTEYKTATTKNEEISLKIIASPIKNSIGETYAYMYSEIDITNSKITKNELEQANNKLTNLISNLPGIVYRCKFDSSYTMTYLSDGVKLITGYSKEELLDNQQVAFVDLIHKDDRDYVYRTISNTTKESRSFSVYYRLFTKSNKQIWVWEKGVVLFNENGQPELLEGYIEDATMQRETMLKSIEGKNQIHIFIPKGSTAMFLADKNGKLKFVNDEACKILNYNAEELLHKSVFDIVHNDIVTETKSNFMNFVSSGLNETYKSKLIRKDGTIINSTINALRIGDNEFIAYCEEIN